MRLRQVLVPKGFLESMPPKLLQQLQAHAHTFCHAAILSRAEYGNLIHLDYAHNINVMVELNEFLKVQFDGFELCPNQDLVREQYFEWAKKARELDALKQSLASIKSALNTDGLK